MPMDELSVELTDNDSQKDPIHAWQLIQTDSKTRQTTCFRFSNKYRSPCTKISLLPSIDDLEMLIPLFKRSVIVPLP